jgi:cytochrome c oxidase subunit II
VERVDPKRDGRGRDLRLWPVILVGLLGGVFVAPTGLRTLRAAPSAEVKAFDITASRFKFEPDVIEVQEGDLVRLTIHSADTTHGLGIKELQVKSKIPKGGAPVTVEFQASKAGTFAFACTEYCGSGHRDMKGRLVVTPKSQ